MNMNNQYKKQVTKGEADVLENIIKVYFRTVDKLGTVGLENSDLVSLFLIVNDLLLRQPVPQAVRQLLMSASEEYHKQLPLLIEQENMELQISKDMEEKIPEETIEEYGGFVKNLTRLTQPEEETEEVEYETETE